MRCKVGDLVVVVRCQPFPQNIGRVGTITEKISSPNICGDWWVKPANTFVMWDGRFKDFSKESDDETNMYDDDIRPIRDPGEDARDETLEWVPKQTPVNV